MHDVEIDDEEASQVAYVFEMHYIPIGSNLIILRQLIFYIFVIYIQFLSFLK